MSKLITWLTLGTSIPRAATSVASKIGTSPLLKRASAAIRLSCGISPCSQHTGISFEAKKSLSICRRSRVFTNTTADVVVSCFKIFTSNACLWFMSSARWYHWWILFFSLRDGFASITSGLLRMSWAKVLTPLPSSVAENNRFCLRQRASAAIWLTTVEKPISNMRSASSRIKHSISRQSAASFSICSSKRPGVATRISRFLLKVSLSVP